MLELLFATVSELDEGTKCAASEVRRCIAVDMMGGRGNWYMALAGQLHLPTSPRMWSE